MAKKSKRKKPKPKPPQWMTGEEVAKLFGVTQQMVAVWRRRRIIPSLDISMPGALRPSYKYPRQQIERIKKRLGERKIKTATKGS